MDAAYLRRVYETARRTTHTHNRRVFHLDTDCWAEFTCFSTYSNLLSLICGLRRCLQSECEPVSWSGVGHCTPSASRSRCRPISSVLRTTIVSRHLTLSFPSRQSPKVISKRYDSILNTTSTSTSRLFEWSSHLNCQLLDFLNSTRKLLRKVHFLRQRLVLQTVVVGSDTGNWLSPWKCCSVSSGPKHNFTNW